MLTTRHFTATGFVISENHLALHWHPKVKAWLPPGGHIEPNENPVQAVLREIKEESGLDVEIIPTGNKLDLEYPKSIMPPFTIMLEDIEASRKMPLYQTIDKLSQYKYRKLRPKLIYIFYLMSNPMF